MYTLAAIGLLSAAQLGAAALLPREAVTTSAEGGYNNYYYYPPSNTSTTSYESVTSYTYTQEYPTIDPTTVTDRNIYTYTNRYDGTAGTYITDRPTPTKYTPHPSVFSTACAGISASYASALASYERRAATDTDAVYPTSIPIRPREAWDCLYSIPLDVDLTLAFIREVTKYIKFQSTIEYLAKPPEGSLQEPIDLLGSLEALAEKVESGDIAHHIRFENAFTKLLQRCHDGHFNFGWNSQQLIRFRGPFSLISISPDGMDKPLVYVENDLLDLGIDNTPYIIRIDGYEVEAWLAEFADFGNSQSPDARYNSIFSNRDPGSDGAFYSLWGWYPGKNYIDITFSNSSTVQYPYRASARWNDILNWTGIADGRDFYNTIVLNPDYIPVETDSIISEPVPTSTAGPDYGNAHHMHDKRATRTRSMRVGTVTSSTRPSSTPTDDVQLIYFNAPFMQHRVGPFVQDLNAIVGGYFLNDTLGTAVIDISSFAAEDENALYQMPGFQQALYAFFDEVRRRESKKLIIDVRGNGGGIIALGFELYKQLFPAAPANSYFRFRAHEAAQIFAATAEAVATDNATEAQMRLIDTQGFQAADDPVSRAIRRAVNSGFSRQNVLDVRGNKPEDLKTFIGPYSLRGAVNDSVSLLVETNLNFSFGDADISGFGVLANFTDTPQPFAIPDILLLSDGTCASTCTIFAELLKREQANISTIVMGGRPNDSPSPHVGGVHGSRVLSYANLLQDTIDVVNFAPPENDEDEKYFVENLPLSLPFGFSYANINFRDAIRPEDPTQTPLQFILEPADCRLYFSPIGYSDSIYLWGELSEFKWGTRSNFTGCAVGGLQKGQASTGEVPPDPETMDIVNWITQGLNP